MRYAIGAAGKASSELAVDADQRGQDSRRGSLISDSVWFMTNTPTLATFGNPLPVDIRQNDRADVQDQPGQFHAERMTKSR